MKQKLKVAAIQMAAGPNPAQNIKTAITLVKRAIRAKAQFIVLPEMFGFRGSAKRSVHLAESLPGKSLLNLMQIAKDHKVWILAGSVLEKKTGSRKSYSTSVLIDPAGRIAARYRKINLFESTVQGATISESNFTLPGNQPIIANIANIKTGLSICFDLRFPKLYQYYRSKGAMMLCIPSSFTRKTGKAHWETLVRARAIENQCYVIAPNQYGKGSGGIDTYGNLSQCVCVCLTLCMCLSVWLSV